jgi:hypothetical protein
MARLQARLCKLEQYDTQKRATRQIRVVYSDAELAQVLPGEVVLRVVYADDSHRSTDLPGSDRP